MYKQKLSPVWCLAGALVCAAGLAAGAVWDLPLDVALFAPDRLGPVLMEAFGFYPVYLSVVLGLACLARDAHRDAPVRVLCGALAALGAAGLALYSAHELSKRALAPLAPLLIAGVWAVLAACILFGLARCQRAALRRLQFVCAWGAAYLAATLAAVFLLKLLWGRMRFDDLRAAGSFDAFTAWFEPFGPGGSSFPSAHTAAACGVLVLVLLCDVFPAWARRRTFVWAACWIYVAGMAVCRMVSGRHFLSDTVAAALVCGALFLALERCAPYRCGARSLNALDAASG